MIALLTGSPAFLKPSSVIIDVNGVGYQVLISLATFEAISGKDKVTLFIHSHIREDAFQLFGFAEEDEKLLFESLISISGVGPKTALTVLSGMRPDVLREAIDRGDAARLATAPGIGKKTAERIILELKGKLVQPSSGGSGGNYDSKAQAVSALVALGYQNKNAEKAVRDAAMENPGASLEELIRRALIIFQS